MDVLKDFPSYGWICKLSKTRCFSGSVGFDGTKGMFVVPTFHYKVWREDDTLHASCYVREAGNERITGSEEEMSWALSEENVAAVKNWLEEQMKKGGYMTC